MSRVVGLTLALLAIAGTAPAAGKKGAPPSSLTLVQAWCDAAPPVPCAPAFAFKSGTATLSSAKPGQPSCPKTGQPTEAKGGDVRLVGVTKGGAPFTGSLPVEVVLRTTFGADPTGNCSFAGIPPIVTPSLQGTVACNAGKCRGAVYPIACLDPPCADVSITSELVSFRVGDDAGNALAVPGTFVFPGREP